MFGLGVEFRVWFRVRKNHEIRKVIATFVTRELIASVGKSYPIEFDGSKTVAEMYDLIIEKIPSFKPPFRGKGYYRSHRTIKRDEKRNLDLRLFFPRHDLKWTELGPELKARKLRLAGLKELLFFTLAYGKLIEKEEVHVPVKYPPQSEEPGKISVIALSIHPSEKVLLTYISTLRKFWSSNSCVLAVRY